MGLSLAEAWRISPRSLRGVSRARNEAALDEQEHRIHAAYAGVWFDRQKKLGPDSLKKMLPKRKRVTHQSQPLTLEEEIRRQDAWANGINRRIAKAEKMQKEQEAKLAAKAKAREAKRRQREARQ